MGGGGLYVEAPGKETPRLRLGRLPGECGQLKVLEPGLEAWTPGSACSRPSAGAGWARHAVPRRAHSGRLQDWPQRAATHLHLPLHSPLLPGQCHEPGRGAAGPFPGAPQAFMPLSGLWAATSTKWGQPTVQTKPAIAPSGSQFQQMVEGTMTNEP